ncbi:MAG: HDOD domain-containing protein [Planctomycetaceae bacterium]
MIATTAIDWRSVREQALGQFTIAALPPTLQLPALPHAVTTYLQKSEDPATPLKELARIIETDTGLTVELLKFVNSTAIALRHRATTVQQALTLLGNKRARTFVVTTGMQAAVRSRKSRLINQGSFWNASLQKALFAKEVAQLLRVDDLEIAFAGALLQDYLLPVITNDLFDSYLAFVENRAAQAKVITDYELAKFGWDHALAGACLAHRWKLPDELVCCVLHHHRGLKLLADPVLGRSAAAAVAVSALIPDQLRQHYQGLEHLLLLQDKWPEFDLAAIAARVDEKQESLGMGMRNDFPLSRRCRPALETVGDTRRGA